MDDLQPKRRRFLTIFTVSATIVAGFAAFMTNIMSIRDKGSELFVSYEIIAKDASMQYVKDEGFADSCALIDMTIEVKGANGSTTLECSVDGFDENDSYRAMRIRDGRLKVHWGSQRRRIRLCNFGNPPASLSVRVWCKQPSFSFSGDMIGPLTIVEMKKN
jgi:hypothetical protein